MSSYITHSSAVLALIFALFGSEAFEVDLSGERMDVLSVQGSMREQAFFEAAALWLLLQLIR